MWHGTENKRQDVGNHDECFWLSGNLEIWSSILVMLRIDVCVPFVFCVLSNSYPFFHHIYLLVYLTTSGYF